VNAKTARSYFPNNKIATNLVEERHEGKEVIIARAGKPMARIVSVRSGRKGRRLGPLAGRFIV